MRTKLCEGPDCPNVIHEKGLGPKEFEGRRFCSLTCSTARRRVDARAVLTPKPCARTGCENMVTARPKEGPASFAAKRYCSTTCQQLGLGERFREGWRPRAATPRMTKPCVVMGCAGELIQRQGEGAKSFANRKYCSDTCRKAGTAQRLQPKRPPGKGGVRLGAGGLSEVKLARTGGEIERAVHRLREAGAVYPMSVVWHPERPPGSKCERWHVHGSILTTQELLDAAAQRDEQDKMRRFRNAA